MKKILLAVLFLTSIFAQQKLTGDFFIDRNIVLDANIQIEYQQKIPQNKKSGLLAGAMSFVVPGTGELYTENYWKAAAFMAFEAVLIYLKLDYDKKGDDQTDQYQSIANAGWSPVRYALESIEMFGLDMNNYPGLFTDGNNSEIANWEVLWQLEKDIASTAGGKYYSHNLARYGEQQYYEMIGKYQQFIPGWENYDNKGFNGYDMSEESLPENYLSYSKERGKANDFYNKASTVMSVIIINHIGSAIDAVFSAKFFNDDLKISAKVNKVDNFFAVEYYPEINLRLRF